MKLWGLSAHQSRQRDRVCGDEGLSATREVGVAGPNMGGKASRLGEGVTWVRRGLYHHRPVAVGGLPVFLATDVWLNFEGCLLVRVQLLSLHTARSTLRTH